jgi:hypothetical protein
VEDLFAQVPENLFSVLASPNRRIYFRALMVLRTCYQEELELRRSDLATRLMAQLEGDLLVLQAEGEEAVPEAEDLPARAHAVVRRLVETGWVVAVMDDSSLEELLLVPRYASVLLEALHAI